MRLAPFVVLLCLALPSRAHAQRSGLLLGLASDSGTAYRTLWIAPVDGRMTIAAERPGVVVPRDSGFWVVDVRRECTMDTRAPYILPDSGGPIDSMHFVDQEDVVLRYRLGDAAPAGAPASCADVARAVVGDSGAVDVGDYCHLSHTRVTHVSPRMVATSGSTIETEFCEPARYTTRDWYEVTGWNDAHLTLLDHLTPARARALEALFERE